LFKKSINKKICAIITASAMSISSVSLAQNDLNLPDLGGGATNIISPQQAKLLGDTLLRMFKAQVPTIEDPILFSYTERTLNDLAEHSELRNKDLQLVIVDNSAINAFAVPGGVIGINTGLYTSATSKDMFASVLAHELAHLSQNHFQRRVEAQQQAALPLLAAMLASIAIAAASGGQAGAAAIMATQAAAQENALRYSRSAESEADRIGINTLAVAGYQPNGMGRMFEVMQRQTMSYGERVPEYLRTHPLSSKRASDARLRAQQYEQPQPHIDQEYQFMRARATVASAKQLRDTTGSFQHQAKKDPSYANASAYGIALASMKHRKFSEAQAALASIETSDPKIIKLVDIARVELARAQEDFDLAQQQLLKLKKAYPNDFSVRFLWASNLYNQQSYLSAITELKALTKIQPQNAQIWFMLAETYGLVGDIIEVHKARAEWFSLNGAFSLATRQLTLAIKLMKSQDYHLIDISRAQERKKQIQRLETRAKQL